MFRSSHKIIIGAKEAPMRATPKGWMTKRITNMAQVMPIMVLLLISGFTTSSPIINKPLEIFGCKKRLKDLE